MINTTDVSVATWIWWRQRDIGHRSFGVYGVRHSCLLEDPLRLLSDKRHLSHSAAPTGHSGASATAWNRDWGRCLNAQFCNLEDIKVPAVGMAKWKHVHNLHQFQQRIPLRCQQADWQTHRFQSAENESKFLIQFLMLWYILFEYGLA